MGGGCSVKRLCSAGGGGGEFAANLKNIKTHKYFFTYLNMVYFLWDCSGFS